MYTQTEINDRTGFENGERFENDAEVRAYFTRATLIGMMRQGNPDDIPSQDELDGMADTVIAHRWHYAN